jgi:hypothetical protein
LGAADVSAVLVTRGDVDLAPILEALPYDDIVVWDNSKRDSDFGAYGRYAAIDEAKNNVIYTQDDDCIVRCHDRLLAAWQEGTIVANMPAERTDYTDSVLVGWGSLFERHAPRTAFERYGRFYPMGDEDWYRVGADFVFPLLTPFKRVDFGFERLPYSRDAHRTFQQPGYEERKRMFLRRARRVRRLTSMPGQKEPSFRLGREALAWVDHSRAEFRVLRPRGAVRGLVRRLG